MFGNIGVQFIPDSVTRETRATVEFSFGNHDHKLERSLKVLEERNYVKTWFSCISTLTNHIYKFL